MKYWREVLIAIIVVVAALVWRQRDAALVERGRAEARARHADSLLATNAAKIARVDTVLRERLVVVPKLVTRADTILARVVDTIYLASDTAKRNPLLPIPAGEVAFLRDTLVPQCNALAKDCAEYKRAAEERFAAYELKLKARPTKTTPLHAKLLWSGIGIGVGRLTCR